MIENFLPIHLVLSGFFFLLNKFFFGIIRNDYFEGTGHLQMHEG